MITENHDTWYLVVLSVVMASVMLFEVFMQMIVVAKVFLLLEVVVEFLVVAVLLLVVQVVEALKIKHNYVYSL